MQLGKAYPCASRVFRFFEQISAVPRRSYLTEPIAEYLCRFAQERDLFCLRDSADNVIIKKGASRGLEGQPSLILQAHTDMVAVRRSPELHPWQDTGLQLRECGDFLMARDTSLGADNGIGMAYILAILDDDSLTHPMLEAVFTSNEEVGLLGASALDCRVLTGRRMINLDSDAEGIITAGCAGGSNVSLSIPFKTKTKRSCYALTLSRLPGGHSGTEIHRGIGNAILLLLAAIERLSESTDVYLSRIEGGEASNAIPSSATVFFGCKRSEKEILDFCKLFLSKQAVILGDGEFSIKKEEVLPCLDKSETDALLRFVLHLPNGILSMEKNLPTQPETSLNLGQAATKEGLLSLYYAVRSSRDARREETERALTRAAEDFGASATVDGRYPAWSYAESSPLREHCLALYRKRYKKEATVEVIHAGLECGIFAAKLPSLDAVSIGPSIRDIHTADEALSLSSASDFYQYLLALLVPPTENQK